MGNDIVPGHVARGNPVGCAAFTWFVTVAKMPSAQRWALWGWPRATVRAGSGLYGVRATRALSWSSLGRFRRWGWRCTLHGEKGPGDLCAAIFEAI